MSSVSSTSSVSPHYSHHRGSINGHSRKHSKPTFKSTVIGKSSHQVERRNARERRRVQAVNQGYEDLAKQISDWDELKNKKLTKAETLKAAILYIQHLEELLNSPAPVSSSASKNSQSIKSEPITFDQNQQIHYHQSRQFNTISNQHNMTSTYTPYFNPMSSEVGNENFMMHYDFNSGRY